MGAQLEDPDHGRRRGLLQGSCRPPVSELLCHRAELGYRPGLGDPGYHPRGYLLGLAGQSLNDCSHYRIH